MGGLGAHNLKLTEQTEIVLEERSMGISPWGPVVFACLDCDVREVSYSATAAAFVRFQCHQGSL